MWDFQAQKKSAGVIAKPAKKNERNNIPIPTKRGGYYGSG
jgi:hypothetical protein